MDEIEFYVVFDSENHLQLSLNKSFPSKKRKTQKI